MNGDITPQGRPQPQPANPRNGVLPPPQQPPVDVESIDLATPPSNSLPPTKPRRMRLLSKILISILAVIVIAAGAVYGWYQWSLQPAAGGKTTLAVMTDVTISPGMTPEQIADELESKSLIRSSLSFVIYTRLENVHGALQTGAYQLNPEMSVPQIVDALTGGQTQQLIITFYPGSTLRDPTDTPDAQRTDVSTMLSRAGFADAEITAALSKQYKHPLFADKPASASLEGYIFGETYQFAPGVSAQEVLEHTFDVYYQKLQDADIINRAKKQGLNLYEAITLASIIEREVQGAEDQRQVAQVFYNRLAEDMPLGSDVTFIYAAEQQNKTPTVDFDSLYNTRIHKGLPPGPIANPGLTALEAVANPVSGDYLYFVAGDDGKTYFARTEAGHQENIDKHCQKLCFE